MIDTIATSFKLRNTYKANSMIFSLKSMPLIKSLLPQSLYASRALKSFANVLGIISRFFNLFLGKAIYVALIFFAAGGLKAPIGNSYINILVLLTFVGGIINTYLFTPTRDKFYAIVLMRMDARIYTLTDYFLYTVNTVIGYLPFIIIFGIIAKSSLLFCLLFPVFVVLVKLCFSAVSLSKCKNPEKILKVNSLSKPKMLCAILLLAAAFVPPYFGYAINEVVFYILTALLIIPAIFSLKYILEFKNYLNVYKKLLKPEFFVSGGAKNASAISQQAMLQQKISVEHTAISKKTGYKYFNEIFMKRHSAILTKSAIKITKILIVILAILAAVCFFWSDIKIQINTAALTGMPYLMFIMYFINRGKVITQAMFMSCDHSMLAYRFYRQPKAIVSLFIERLRYVILVNLMPAAVIAVGAPLLLFISGGTDNPLNYLVLFLSVMAMSIFFSVHNMVLYYLFQPYNIELETKSSLYNIVNLITYFLCYFAIGKTAPTLTFGIVISIFCISYAVIAVFLAYKLAPKTFKLRK